MRLFVGIPIPEELKQKCAEAQIHLKGKLVPQANFHFTLKFLGEQDNTSEIMEILNKIAKKHKPFQLHLHGIGAFPSAAKPDVVWIGTKPSREFISLAEDIHKHLDEFHKEEHKEIIPHLTITREEKKLPRLKQNQTFGSVEVKKFNLYESASGTYKVLQEFPLRPPIAL
ncbi:MAG TPA: RNA 2',3'-cyclic phosphodiesterase [Candidatus Nanoarchaeia archaeon]|nr:RNA 2',3'-cyclic phosphodiesterase [Candidatus Nanoarchaeia archaeon]